MVVNQQGDAISQHITMISKSVLTLYPHAVFGIVFRRLSYQRRCRPWQKKLPRIELAILQVIDLKITFFQETGLSRRHADLILCPAFAGFILNYKALISTLKATKFRAM